MIRAIVIVAISAALAALFTVMDRAGLFFYFPYWPVVGGASLILALSARPPKRRIELGAAAALAIWGILILPRVRWDVLKSFYVDCWSLSRGMPVREAREKMSRYVEASRTGIQIGSGGLDMQLARARDPRVPETESEHSGRILFIPPQRHGADWCIVYPDGDQVARVEISPD